ncbi:MAG: hypothetical protein LQ350_004108 [Teloschistes chrysophthalmus]|nr:MAG: hypothetical protein LQ350_004108 [Niorma chrysophthalma]
MPDDETQSEDVPDTSYVPVEEKQKASSKRDDQDVAQPVPVEVPQTGPTRLRDLEWNGCLYPTRISDEEEYTKWMGHVHYQTNELDYDRTFITHVELYAMGCQYLLDDLRALTWQRMKNALVAVGTPFAGSTLITNVTNVIHYVFQQTGDLPDGEEQMRGLLTTFVTDHFKQIRGAPAFDELIGAKLDHKDELLRLEQEKIAELKTNLLIDAEEQARLLRVEKEKTAKFIGRRY